MKLKKLMALVMCMTMIMGLAACGSETKEKVVGVTEPTYPPFETTDEDGNLVGFDIDLINAIAEDQGFEIEMKTMSFDALIPAVESKQADMIIAGISENPERAEHVAFTDPYYDSGSYMVVKADSPITSEEDIPADAKIACQTGTVQQKYAQALVDAGKGSEVVVLDQHTTCMLQLENGDVDVVAGDLPVLDEHMKNNPGKFKSIGPMSTQTGDSLLKMAVGLDNEDLKAKLNAGLANIIANGTYKELCEKWGITPME